MRIRILGAAQIIFCTLAILLLYREANMPPFHQATPGELLLAFAAVLTGLPGLLLLVVGDGFRRV